MNKNRKHLQKVLDSVPSCYVLITCGKPTEKGEMQVEMTYEGDASMVSYLLCGAQQIFDHEEPSEEIVPAIHLVKKSQS